MDHNPLFVPTSLAEITPEWLRLALRESFPAVSFRPVHVERVGQEYGLASQIFRCRLSGPGAPGSVIVKLWGTAGPAGSREVLFYREFAPGSGLRIPACYHAALDEEQQAGVLVLEDFENASQGDCLEQLSFARAVALTKAIAAFQAYWWQRAELRAAGWLPSITSLNHGEDWYQPRREAFLQRFGSRLTPLAGRLLERILPVQARANERLAGAAPTLLHADLHLDNVLFAGDPGQPILLDWARVAQGPAALDLAELLFSIGGAEHRDSLLAAYLASLRRGGVTALNETALREQLGGALLRKFISATIGIARWEPANEREAAMIDLGLQRVLAAIAAWQGQDSHLFSF